MKIFVLLLVAAAPCLALPSQAACPATSACCVNQTSLNDAFTAARQKWNLTTLIPAQTVPNINLLGQVLDETVRIMTSKCQIPPSMILTLLPQFSPNVTGLSSFCPSFLKDGGIVCNQTKYRSYDGTCNNAANPYWGSTFTPLRRLLPAEYSDSLSKPRNSSKSSANLPLPTPREVSTTVHRDSGLLDSNSTLYLLAWGQALDHDISRTPTYVDINNTAPSCCDNTTTINNTGCMSLNFSKTDRFYCQVGVNCINFVRSAAAVSKNCNLGPMNQMNILTSYIDGSFIYGNSLSQANSLRNFTGGLLRTSNPFGSQKLKDLLPLSGSATCPTCFVSGDGRVNENLLLPVIHTLFLREHNRIATKLASINPSWNDERLYQEARRIVGALMQKITYDEYLPILLGSATLSAKNLALQQSGFFTGYDANAEPSLANEFSTAAYRFGHSMLPTGAERWTNTHRYIATDNFRLFFNNPTLNTAGYMDQYLVGFGNQAVQKMDSSVVQEVTNFLYQAPTDFYGKDLASLNIQRGRDHGLPSYNAYRVLCGLQRAESWELLASSFPAETLSNFRKLYKSPDDLDLWSAGISELPTANGILGPTFSCIVADTFRNLRVGDRFWFENSGFMSSFTEAQLAEIRKIKLARVICDNGDNIVTIQQDVMKLPDCVSNPRISCTSTALPGLNLTLWKE